MHGSFEQKVITCILPKGNAQAVLCSLVKNKGVNAVDIHFARGVGRITPLSHRGIGETSEKEILTVSIPAAQADELFEYIYDIANINRPHGGMMYMQALSMTSHFELPDLPEEE